MKTSRTFLASVPLGRLFIKENKQTNRRISAESSQQFCAQSQNTAWISTTGAIRPLMEAPPLCSRDKKLLEGIVPEGRLTRWRQQKKEVVLWFLKSWLRGRWKQVRTTPVFISATFGLIMITKLIQLGEKVHSSIYVRVICRIPLFSLHHTCHCCESEGDVPVSKTTLVYLNYFPAQKISCLLMMTRFRFGTWVGRCLCFRYGRDMVLIWKCSWLWGENLLLLLNFPLWTFMSI